MDFADRNDFGGLIDVSSEDDCLFDSSPHQHHLSQANQEEDKYLESLEAVYADRSKDASNTFEGREQPPQLSESMEPEIKKKVGKCNLRKSLAWDSAFFTSAGVLDPEELSSIIEGVKNSDKSSLPVIEEDLRQSTDSISTLESDSLAMEDIETNLFEDIRASIQKSSKAASLVNLSGKSAPVESKTQPISSKKTADFSPRNKINAKPVPKNTSCVIQGTGKTIKQSFPCPQATQPTAKRESISSLSKPPKVLPRAPKVLPRAQKVAPPRSNPISTVQAKRVSLGASFAKVDNENPKVVTGAVVNVGRVAPLSKATSLSEFHSKRVAAGRGAPVSKLPVLTNSRSTVPRPKFSSVLSTKSEPITPSSSIDSSSSVSSDKTGISSISTSQGRKIDSKSSSQPSSGSLPRTPSRTAVRHKTYPGNSNLSAYLKSMPKSSSSISPASSISEWSSVSSSSTSTVNRPSSLKISTDSISSGRGISSDNDANQAFQRISSDQFSDGHQNQGMGLARQTVKKTSVERDKPPCSASTKPSGLKLPSPKIGFFDGVKSPAGTPKRESQSHSGLQSGLSKIAASSSSPCGSSKAKSVKNLNVTSPKTARNSRLKAESSRPEGPHTAKFVSAAKGFEGDLENQMRTGNVGSVCLEDAKITSIKTDVLSRESAYAPKVEVMKASKKVNDEISPKTAAACSSPYGSTKAKSVKGLNVTSPKTAGNSRLKAENSRNEGPHTAKFVSKAKGFEGELENQTRTGNVGSVFLDVKINSIKTDVLSCESGYELKDEGMKASKKVDDEISPKTADESCLTLSGSSCIEGPDLSVVEEKGFDSGFKSHTITGNVGYDHLEGTHVEVSSPYCALISPFVEDIKSSKDGLENDMQFLSNTNETEKAFSSNQIESKLLVGAVDHDIELIEGTDDGFSSESHDNCLDYISPSRNAGPCQIFSEVHEDLSESGDKNHSMIQSSGFEGLDTATVVSDPDLDGQGKGCEDGLNISPSRNAGSCQIFSEVRKDLSESGDKTHLMIQSRGFEGLDTAKVVSDSGLDGEGKGCEDGLNIISTKIDGLACEPGIGLVIENVEASQEADESSCSDQNQLKNNMHLVNRSNEKEKALLTDPVEDLVRLLAAVDLNLELQREGVTDSLSESMVDCEENFGILKSQCPGKLGQDVESVKNLSKLSSPLLLSPTVETVSSPRIPLAAKNYFSNGIESLNLMRKSAIEGAEEPVAATALSSRECVDKENS